MAVIPFVGARYERSALPAAGAAGDQDAHLTEALAHLRAVHNTLLAEHRPRKGKGTRQPMDERTRRRRRTRG